MNIGLLYGMKAKRARLPLRVRVLPILFFESYLVATVLLFRYGPWPWPVRNGLKLYSYLALTHVSLLFGYLSVIFKKPCGYYGQVSFRRLIQVSLLLNWLLLFPTSFYRTGKLLPDVLAGFRNPGAAYAWSLSWRAASWPVIEYVRVILGPFLFLLQPLVVFYWNSLSRCMRYLSVLYIALYLAVFVSMGTNKAIADVILVLPIIALAARYAGMFRVRLRHRVFILACLLTAMVLFFAFFTVGQMTRPGSGAVTGYFPAADIFADQNHPLVRHLPLAIRAGVISLSSYLTQGYYALSLCLDKPFIPMWGIGNSMFLYRNLSKLLGDESIARMPYPVRIEADGWDAYVYWSSIYPWLASDFSFLGTVLVIFLIGRLFAMSWLDSIRGENPFAVAALAQFSIMLYYFPANNQCLQSGESFMSLWVVIVLWLVTRKRYVLRSCHSYIQPKGG